MTTVPKSATADGPAASSRPSPSEDNWFDRDIEDFVVTVKPVRPANSVFDDDDDDDDGLPPTAAATRLIVLQDPGAADTGNYFRPADAPTVRADPNPKRLTAPKLVQLLDQPDGYLLPLGVAHETSGFRTTIDRSTVPNNVIRLSVKLVAGLCRAAALRQHVRDVLHIVRTVPIFWSHIDGVLREMVRENKRLADAALLHKQTKGKGSVVVGGPKNRKTIAPPLTGKEIAHKKGSAKSDVGPPSAEADLAFLADICQVVRSLPELDGGAGLGHGHLDRLVQVIGGQADWKRFADDLAAVGAAGADVQPPSVYPSLAEFEADAVVAAAAAVTGNRVTGPYDSVGHYVRAQMALLRHDLLLVLREDVAAVREGRRRVVADHRIEVLRRPEHPPDLVAFAVRRRADAAGDTPMYGSLLMFSSSSAVEDLVVAVVVHTGPFLEEKGYVQIEIVSIEKMATVLNTPLVLVESSVYFEPYHQVYTALSERRHASSFPHHMKRHLVDAQPSAVVPVTEARIGVTSGVTTRRPALCNPSQIAAIETSLSHRFSLIHGPPGTGKTFVGLQLVQQLLRDTDADLPILVLSASNQALDQFLGKVSALTPSIVRLGNQSKSDKLVRFNVRQLHQAAGAQNPLVAKRLRDGRDALNRCRERLEQELLCCGSTAAAAAAAIVRKDGRPKKAKGNVVEGLLVELGERQRRLDELRQVADYKVVRGRRVIGMTSTRAAYSRTLLRLLAVKVVIVEEAAEMLESHIVAALTPSVERLILFGDHKQLRPQTGSHRSAGAPLHLDVSLFERMLNNGLVCSQLTIQHRMHPRIADLVRCTGFYERLDDAPSAVAREMTVNFRGHNVYLFDHQHAEHEVGSSKANAAEAQLVRTACDQLLVDAGVPPADIVILCMYAAQAAAVASTVTTPGRYRGVRVEVLDNFQGRESRVILLSLVRSNAAGRIGHVATENRVCVAVSRAREALFLFGDLAALGERSEVWARLGAHLRGLGGAGDGGTELRRLPGGFGVRRKKEKEDGAAAAGPRKIEVRRRAEEVGRGDGAAKGEAVAKGANDGTKCKPVDTEHWDAETN